MTLDLSLVKEDEPTPRRWSNGRGCPWPRLLVKWNASFITRIAWALFRCKMELATGTEYRALMSEIDRSRILQEYPASYSAGSPAGAGAKIISRFCCWQEHRISCLSSWTGASARTEGLIKSKKLQWNTHQGIYFACIFVKCLPDCTKIEVLLSN